MAGPPGRKKVPTYKGPHPKGGFSPKVVHRSDPGRSGALPSDWGPEATKEKARIVKRDLDLRKNKGAR